MILQINLRRIFFLLVAVSIVQVLIQQRHAQKTTDVVHREKHHMMYHSMREKNTKKNPTSYISLHDKIQSSKPEETDCIKVRGEYGYWEADYEMASKTQYIPIIGFRQRNFQQQFETSKYKHNGTAVALLPQSTFAWRETKYPQCKLQLMTRDGFCAVLQQLNIENVFFVGDSMTQAMFVSMLGLLSLQGEQDHDGAERAYPAYGQFIQCKPGNGSPLRLYFYRSNLYAVGKPPRRSVVTLDTLGTEKIGVIKGWGQYTIGQCPIPNQESNNKTSKQTKFVTTLGPCPWIEDYAMLQGRTLLILNHGAAFHSKDSFNLSFDGMLQSLDNLTKRDDIAFFRSVSPGHYDCFNTTARYVPERPLANFSEYLRLAETSIFAWDKFKIFNEYARQRLVERAIDTPNYRSTFPLYFLNIFNMTALRPDGHVASNDCLHYEMPGPVDWWNHLLYSNLLSLANSRKETAMM